MSRSRKILVLFGHPAIQKSRVNRQLAQAAREVAGVTFHDLYEAYPDLAIDVKTEQELLLAHDVIVFQHPFYWYSAPAIFKEWNDLVLEYGFAYGPGGEKLENKAWLNVITTGGPEDAYNAEGYNRFTIRQLLAPMDQTAYLCGMHFLPPFSVHGTLDLHPIKDIPGYARAYARLLEGLRDSSLPLAEIAGWSTPRMNTEIEKLHGGMERGQA